MTGVTSGFGGAGYEAVIVAGDGVGEHVQITGYNAATGVITLAGSWPVIPDASSVITLGEVFDGIVVYQNHIQGKGITNTASAGVEVWGGGMNVIVDSNTMSNLRYGVMDYALDQSGKVDPSYFNLIQNNTITNVQTGMIIENDSTSGQIGMLGTIVRDDQVNNAASQGFWFDDEHDAGNQHFYVIVEGNMITNAPIAVSIRNVGSRTTNLAVRQRQYIPIWARLQRRTPRRSTWA